MEAVLPRLRFPESAIAMPATGFGVTPEEVWLEVGFGGGEHARALAAANPAAGLRGVRERHLFDALGPGAGRRAW
jgi:tRNA (guanine-N7-)-methyltransferase